MTASFSKHVTHVTSNPLDGGGSSGQPQTRVPLAQPVVEPLVVGVVEALLLRGPFEM